jgi:hypothetical protein
LNLDLSSLNSPTLRFGEDKIEKDFVVGGIPIKEGETDI